MIANLLHSFVNYFLAVFWWWAGLCCSPTGNLLSKGPSLLLAQPSSSCYLMNCSKTLLLMLGLVVMRCHNQGGLPTKAKDSNLAMRHSYPPLDTNLVLYYRRFKYAARYLKRSTACLKHMTTYLNVRTHV